MKSSYANLYGLLELSSPLSAATAGTPDFAWAESMPLGMLSDRLVTAAPSSIQFVGAVRSRGRAERSQIRLVAVGRARTPYTVISQIARVLAPTLPELGVLPIIDPFLVKDFASLGSNERAMRRLFSRSVALLAPWRRV